MVQMEASGRRGDAGSTPAPPSRWRTFEWTFETDFRVSLEIMRPRDWTERLAFILIAFLILALLSLIVVPMFIKSSGWTVSPLSTPYFL